MVSVSRWAQVFLTQSFDRPVGYLLQADPAGVLEHRRAIDFEALAELDISASDQPVQMRLALDQRQFAKVATVQILHKRNRTGVPWTGGDVRMVRRSFLDSQLTRGNKWAEPQRRGVLVLREGGVKDLVAGVVGQRDTVSISEHLRLIDAEAPGDCFAYLSFLQT